ncbi:hypothetical protein [Sorangium sp. So ce1078]|uniref:hypothetical protein n=1 Tax=Sorangium sp. So ce1078 TaxID=3133329 RepID=UPI003F600F89
MRVLDAGALSLVLQKLDAQELDAGVLSPAGPVALQSIGQVAKDLDLTETALRDWIKPGEDQAPPTE